MGALWNPETNSPSRDPGSCTLSSEQSSPPSTHGSPGTQLSACRPCLDTLCPPRVSLTTGPLGDLGASAHQQTPSGSLPPLKSPPSRECGCGARPSLGAPLCGPAAKVRDSPAGLPLGLALPPAAWACWTCFPATGEAARAALGHLPLPPPPPSSRLLRSHHGQSRGGRTERRQAQAAP